MKKILLMFVEWLLAFVLGWLIIVALVYLLSSVSAQTRIKTKQETLKIVEVYPTKDSSLVNAVVITLKKDKQGNYKAEARRRFYRYIAVYDCKPNFKKGDTVNVFTWTRY